jgi:signal peptidase I
MNGSKQPWLAVNISLLLPGLGQIYGNQLIKGLLISLIFLGLIGRGLWQILAAPGHTVTGFWQLGIAALIYGGSLWDAYQGVTQRRPTLPRKVKNAWYGVFLSQLLPGLGHLYLDQPLIGGLFLLTGIGLAYWANNYAPLCLPLAYGIWAIAGYHAYRIAPHDRYQPTRSSQVALLMAGLMATRVLIGYVPIWINQIVVQCIVPSESMTPNLQINDRIFVSRNFQYRPETGDIVVFSPPPEAISIIKAEPDALFVKRIIGLPGQQIQMHQGQVWINQHLLSEPYPVQPATYEWGPETVPAQAYFVLGDNRDNSADSHVWGFLPRSHLLGKAYKIYWPPERIQSLLNSDPRESDFNQF